MNTFSGSNYRLAIALRRTALTAILALLALMPAVVRGQGLVNFFNSSTTLISGMSTGAIYYFALLTAPPGTTDRTAFAFSGLYATNTATVGRIRGGANVAVPGWPAGAERSFFVCGWPASYGTTFNPAWLQGLGAPLGMSMIATGTAGGVDEFGQTLPTLYLFGSNTIFTGFDVSGCLGPYWYGFAQQPTNQTVRAGGTARFCAAAMACPAGLVQWYRDGNAIAGANVSCYELLNVQPEHGGTYYAVFSNPSWGTHTTAQATLTVLSEPFITTQPQNQSVFVGASTAFVVTATGAGLLSYFWYLNQTNLLAQGLSPVLQIANAQLTHAGTYSVVVSNAYGTVTSQPATLTVIASPPVLVTAPRNQRPREGWSVDFSANVVGALPLSYQWRFNDGAIAGATTSVLHLTGVRPSDSGYYTLVITNAYGAITSPPAMLTMTPSPAYPQPGTVVVWGDQSIPYVEPGTPFTAIASGSLHNVALKPDGTVVAWGLGSAGQCRVPPGLNNVISIVAGGDGVPGYSAALKSDGTVVSWGMDYPNGVVVPVGLSNVTALAAGGQHCLALKSDRTVVAWGGYNVHGETTVPTGLADVVAIGAGQYNSLAVRENGTVVCWGYNGYGQNDGAAGLGNIAAVAAGQMHCIALSSNGTVSVWGYPGLQPPAGLQDVTAIAAGFFHNLALKRDGTVVGWPDSPAGTVPAGLTNVIAISAGEEHSLALRADGTVVAWGSNDYGQGIAPMSITNIVSIASGAWTQAGHSLALRSDGTVFSWGRLHCQSNSSAPQNLTNVLSLAAGECHNLAVQADGSVLCWGNNDLSQVTIPAGLTNVVALAAGDFHSLALKSDGTVTGWGWNVYGQTTVSADLDDAIAVAAGYGHSIALKSNGKVVAWGSNSNYQNEPAGQSVVPPDLDGVVAIAAGGFHNVALRANNTVVCWGNNTFGECSVPAGLTNVVAVAAGVYHSLGLKSDGTMVAWGDTSAGEGDLPQVPLPVTGIAAAGLRSLALISESTNLPPRIVLSPEPRIADAGCPLNLIVRAAGTAPLHYQWLREGHEIIGATDALLHLPNAQPEQSGQYSVTVTNAFGSASSAPVLVSIIGRSPAIQAGPTNTTAGVGSKVDFAVTATGGCQPLFYQWLFEGRPIATATNSLLRLERVDFALSGLYAVVVTNGFGAVTSAPARLNVVAAPVRSLVESSGQAGCSAWVESIRFTFAHYENGSLPGTFKVFDGLDLTVNDIGREFTVTAAEDPDFTELVSLLTNGSSDWLGWFVNAGPCGAGMQTEEPRFFGSLPAGGNGIDFQGFRVVSFTMRLVDLRFYPTPTWTDYSWRIELSVNYETYEPPMIVAGLLTQTAEVGSDVRLSIRTLGSIPLHYQWLFNGTNLLTTFTTNNSLLLTNVQPGQAGAFSVVVTNPAGVVTSAPGLLSIVPGVERRSVPALSLAAPANTALQLEYSDSANPLRWLTLPIVDFTNAPQFWFDLSTPLPSQRFYRASAPGGPPGLDLHMVPAITLTGAPGSSVRLDYINRIGPIDAWIPLATVNFTLTNTSEVYFDASGIHQPSRLYRIVPAP